MRTRRILRILRTRMAAKNVAGARKPNNQVAQLVLVGMHITSKVHEAHLTQPRIGLLRKLAAPDLECVFQAFASDGRPLGH